MNTARSKQWLSAICMCLLLVAGWPEGLASVARAEMTVQLGVTAGVGGEYKESGIVPVQVSITNTGEDVEGELVVATGDRGTDMFSTAYYQSISVAKGATKQVTITVPGSEIGFNTYVALVKDERILAKAPLGGRRYRSDTVLIGVLSANADTGNFLGIMPKNSFPNEVRVMPIKPDQVPTAGTQMNMVDMLVLNNFALDSLNPQQIQAIRDWTRSGGKLVIAGGAQYKKTAGELADLSPVDVNRVSSVQGLTALNVDKNKPLVLTAPFTVSAGSVKAGKVLYAEGDIPLLVSGKAGEGKVLYVAYDLAQEPVSSWAGNSALWAEALNKAFGSSLNQDQGALMDNLWPMSEAAERIPSLKLPEVSWFAVFFGVYALIAGPVFFYILRSKRKQSYMWAIVPVLSIVTGVGIFSFGAMQRGAGVLAHHAGVVQVMAEGQAKVKAVTALFVPSRGDYRVSVKGSGLVQPVIESRRPDELPKVWVSMQPEETEITFRDVEFWSMRKVASEQIIPDAGIFQSSLSYRDGALKGTVTNKTKYSLKDVTIFSGTQVQKFPELPAGGSVEVNIPFQPSAQTHSGNFQLDTRQLLPANVQTTYFQNTREEVLIDSIDNRNRRGSQSAQVEVVGWVHQPVVDAVVQGAHVNSDSLSLLTSVLEVNPAPDGQVFFPAGTFEAVKSANSVPVDEDRDGYYMEKGDITFDFDLIHEEQKVNITNLHMYTWSEDNTPFDKQVFNWKTNAYEPYDKAFTNNTMTGDKTAAFVSADGVLRVKFVQPFTDQRHLGMPVISVEGKVANR